MDLPRFILLKSTNNNKYLRYRKEKDSNHAFLQFSQDEKEENVEIQYAKFEVQKSETVQGFVHIRSCYNNKYWVRKSGDSKRIAAEANEPEEDESKCFCTLFKAVVIDSDDEEKAAAADVAVDADLDVRIPQITKPQKIRLVHNDQLGRQNACVALSNTDHGLVIGGEGEDEGSRTTSTSFEDVFIAYDATSLVVLPERVAFIGGNEKYATAITVGTTSHLEFAATEIGERGVVNIPTQLLLNQPQTVDFQNTSLLNTANKGWWSLMRDTSGIAYVLLKFKDLTDFGRVSFTPLRLGGNQLLLRCFVIGFNTTDFANIGKGFGPGYESRDNMLLISPTTLNQSAIFAIVEPILFRQINNVSYDLADSRVYNITSVEKYRDERRNNTSAEQTGSFSVEYQVSQTMTWEDSVSVTRTLSASMSSSIPFVGISFGVEISSSQERTFVWGNEVAESRTVSYVQEVTIPPGKKITMVVVATRAQCNVPFTCDVHEIVIDGEVRNYRKTDGIYLGANEFSFVTDLIEEDL